MLEFKPGSEKDGIYSYSAYEKDVKIGECTFSIDGMYMEVLSISADIDELTAEGLVRSALNFGANRNAYIAKANPDKVSTTPFITLGFNEEKGFLVSDIPSALQGSCKDCR